MSARQQSEYNQDEKPLRCSQVEKYIARGKITRHIVEYRGNILAKRSVQESIRRHDKRRNVDFERRIISVRENTRNTYWKHLAPAGPSTLLNCVLKSTAHYTIAVCYICRGDQCTRCIRTDSWRS